MVNVPYDWGLGGQCGQPGYMIVVHCCIVHNMCSMAYNKASSTRYNQVKPVYRQVIVSAITCLSIITPTPPVNQQCNATYITCYILPLLHLISSHLFSL